MPRAKIDSIKGCRHDSGWGAQEARETRPSKRQRASKVGDDVKPSGCQVRRSTLMPWMRYVVACMVHLSVSTSIGWLSLDAWSEAYVGARWLAQDELPAKQWETQPQHGSLSQLVLIASHRLVEIMLFRCIGEILEASPGKFPVLERRLSRVSFEEAFGEWPAKLGFPSFDTTAQPFSSIKRLQDRRNSTIHKESALATLEMARSALFSAVEGSKAIATHLGGAKSGFKYERVLEKYPLPTQPWLTDVKFLERRT